MANPQRRKGESDFEVHETGTFKMISETSLEIAAAVGLLEQARCPDENCVDGTVQFGSGDDWGIRQCQWCEMRKQFIDDNTGEGN